MLSCWSKDRNNRPGFREIVLTLDRLIKNSEMLKKNQEKSGINGLTRLVLRSFDFFLGEVRGIFVCVLELF